MVVRLQTADGKIREYNTIYGESETFGDGYCITRYLTNCGREWEKKPKQHEECDHLDCAIFLAKRQKGGPGFILFIALAAFMLIVGAG